MAEQKKVKVDEQAVRDIISSKGVTTFFQPVVSITTKSIVGFEAYSRSNADACPIDTSMLFHDDLKPELKVEVDRLCREKALEQFKPIHANHKGLLLYLNINPDIIPHLKEEDIVLPKQVEESGINPANIVLECPFAIEYMDGIAMYGAMFAKAGFKICLDGCSVDHGFSHVMTKIRPNMVKVDRSFFGDAERKDYSAKTLDALQAVAGRVGASVVGQQVETEDESLRLLSSGIHLQQGYYYTKDENAKSGDPAKMFFQKILDTHEKYKTFKRDLVRRIKERFSATFKAVTSVCAKFANMSEDRFEDGCKTLVHNVEGVISLFVLNNNGEQVTHRAHSSKNAATTNSDAILGSTKGADHSVQDYMRYLDMGYEKFVAPPSVSPFTGEDACIISRPFFSQDGLRYVVCVELPYPG